MGFVFHMDATLSICAATAVVGRIDSEGAIGLHIDRQRYFHQLSHNAQQIETRFYVLQVIPF